MNEAGLQKVIDELQSPLIVSWEQTSEKAFQFTLNGTNRQWAIKLNFAGDFPFKLPQAVLIDPDMIGKLPHVNRAGVICFEESDSLWVDHSKPTLVVDHFLAELVKALDRYSLAIYQDELLDEFEGYFLAPNIGNSVNSFYRAGEEVEEPKLRTQKLNPKRESSSIRPVVIQPLDASTLGQFSNVIENGNLPVQNIIHLPLDNAVLPPANGEELSSQYIYDLLKEVNSDNKKRLDKLLKRSREHFSFFILLSMPRSTGERTQLLLQFTSSECLPHPLLVVNNGWQIHIFRLNQLNAPYLLERNGSEASLQAKHVAVIGCGSVGGEVAYMLAKAGIGKLTLFDNDYLEPDNIYRHRLGGRSLNFKPDSKGNIKSYTKTSSLKLALEQDLPYIKVNSIPKLFRQDQLSELEGVDLVVIAVGSPSESFMINRLLNVTNIKRAVYCWNEATGIGGHAIAVDFDHSCFECLHCGEQGMTASTKLSLLELGQPTSKNLTGCAGVFTPFSYLDSSRTAEAATQLAIGFLTGNRHSVAISWKGDNSHHFKTSERFDSMPLKEETPLKQSAFCGVCNE